MLNITMTKKGIGTVNFTQSSEGDMVVVTLIGNISFETTPDGANKLYTQYLQNGFTVKPQKERKVSAPKEPKAEKPKRTREEALTAKYGDKETRRQYVEAKKYFRRYWLNKGLKYGEMFEYTVKLSLDNWEASGRPALA